jgi:hypothetical protein
MTDKDEQLKRLRDAVERKEQAAEEASRARPDRSGPAPDEPAQGAQRSLDDPGRPQDARSAREKSAGKGKKTADKWNQ